MIAGPARDPRLDALRGFALFGILLVNIQSFVSGAPNALGYLPSDAGTPDRVTYFLTASLVLGKFMPLFGMLFGASFALLYDKLATAYAEPRRLYRRRLAFLAAFGLLHALFVYFGDITLAYAIAGLVLLHHAEAGVAQLARAAALWWLVALAWLLLTGVWALSASADDAAALAEMVERNVEATLTLGYMAQWRLRLEMGLWQIQANLFGLPTVIALMLTGALAQRAGWLQDPGATAWRRAATLGLALGLPAALVYGFWSVSHSELEESLAAPASIVIVQALGLTLSFLYAATFLRHAPRAVVAWLAPAGRMPLTNYLLQSIAMAVLLPGWGAGFGATLSYAELGLLAIGLFAAQTAGSRWWLAHHAQGPLEALWRAWTYRGAVPIRPPA